VSAEKKQLKRDNKRTGVGYSTGIGKIWNVSKYLKTKETKNTQITEIVMILNKILTNTELCEKYGFKEVLIESSMVPMLENAFRSGSILELSKEYELYTSYLDFTQVMCNSDYFLPILMPLGAEYEPKQLDPVFKLLGGLNDLATIFLKAIDTNNQNEESEKPKKISQKIIDTYNSVMKKVKASQANQEEAIDTLDEIRQMPLPKAYLKLLSH